MDETELMEAWDDMEAILDAAVEEWRLRREDYRDAFMALGSKGQFSEIWRKVAKLKNSVWDGNNLNGETPDQIALEIIPHCAMMIYLLREEENA